MLRRRPPKGKDCRVGDTRGCCWARRAQDSRGDAVCGARTLRSRELDGVGVQGSRAKLTVPCRRFILIIGDLRAERVTTIERGEVTDGRGPAFTPTTWLIPAMITWQRARTGTSGAGSPGPRSAARSASRRISRARNQTDVTTPDRARHASTP